MRRPILGTDFIDNIQEQLQFLKKAIGYYSTSQSEYKGNNSVTSVAIRDEKDRKTYILLRLSCLHNLKIRTSCQSLSNAFTRSESTLYILNFFSSREISYAMWMVNSEVFITETELTIRDKVFFCQ